MIEKTILVVDDHPMFRDAMSRLVQERGNRRVLTAPNAEEGLQLVRQDHVDLILLDLGLPGASGVDAVTLFRQACNATLIVVSATEHRQEIASATRAGATAVISKGVSREVLQDTVDRALCGSEPQQKWIHPPSLLAVGDEVGRGLTPRQRQIAAHHRPAASRAWLARGPPGRPGRRGDLCRCQWGWHGWGHGRRRHGFCMHPIRLGDGRRRVATRRAVGPEAGDATHGERLPSCSSLSGVGAGLLPYGVDHAVLQGRETLDRAL